jgi:hypothetical protein
MFALSDQPVYPEKSASTPYRGDPLLSRPLDFNQSRLAMATRGSPHFGAILHESVADQLVLIKGVSTVPRFGSLLTSTRRWPATRRRDIVAKALLGLLPVLTLALPVTAHAASTNANLDGTWAIFQEGKPLDGNFDITGEDLATGSFGGRVNIPPSPAKFDYYDIIDGQVSGDSFTITAVYPGTVVDVNGLETTYSGTVDGSTMKGEETDLEGWRNGHKVSLSADGDQTFTAKRDEFKLSGTIIFGCSGDGASCSSNSSPLYDATVNVDGSSSATTTTDTDGTWKVSVPKGRYVITPTAPGVTFTPASLDIDVTKNADGQDFSGCGATSSDDASAPNLRISSHASSGAWSLTGVYCWNTYKVMYSPSTGRASVTWISDAWVCSLHQASQFMYAEFGRTFYNNATVGSDATPGSSFPENGGAIVQVQDAKTLVLSFHLNAGGASGSVSTNGKQYGKTITRDGVEHFCQPVDGTNSPLPHFEKKGKVKH